MRRISSRMTFFYKRIFPVLWLGFILTGTATSILALLHDNRPVPWPLLLIPAFMLLVGVLLMKAFIFDVVDEVWDTGGALISKNKSREERIAFSDVMKRSYTSFVNPQRATLTLGGAGTAVRDIGFLPPVRITPFARSPVVDGLIRRVDAARRGRRQD